MTIAAIAASVFVLGKAEAMPLSGGLGDAADRMSAVEKTQFVYLGRNYCWYPDGWHGPGFYWCGYAYRTGYGWGGPIGWRGWRGGGPGFRVGAGRRIGGPGMRAVGPRMGAGPRMGGPRMGGGGGGGGGVRRH
ncbi:MAG: hypothetical protein E6G97_00030 [Alphaproteobacteria bacterium]|nr:MAG: hypothetical protein E6G97_00030 [Alphaproteobacteria bacterium]